MGKKSPLKNRNNAYGFSPDVLLKLLNFRKQLKDKELETQAGKHLEALIDEKGLSERGRKEIEIVYSE